MYSILIAGDKQKNTAAGVKKCVRDKELQFAPCTLSKNLAGYSDSQSIKSIPRGSLYSSNDLQIKEPHSLHSGSVQGWIDSI